MTNEPIKPKQSFIITEPDKVELRKKLFLIKDLLIFHIHHCSGGYFCVTSIPQYVAEFNKIYDSKQITLAQVTNAIAAFEETLVTPNSRFDLWLKGNDNALTETEVAGYLKFKQIGCAACHNGEGGSSFQKMGIIKPYQTENPTEGRMVLSWPDCN